MSRDVRPVDKVVGTQCRLRCDCPQGLECTNGFCQKLSQPAYCCDKLACPSGQVCLSVRSGKGLCGALGFVCNSACDCQDGLGCINGQCTRLTHPVYCCARKNACPAGAKCEEPSGQEKRCGGTVPTCQTHCDCDQGSACVKGQCSEDPKKRTLCCAKSSCKTGEACYNPDGSPGVCGEHTCTSNADCSGTTCSQSGTLCTQRNSRCFQGKCQLGITQIPNAQCGKDGICRKNSACKVHCDCSGGCACINGQCVQTPGKTYWCCGDPKCPPNTLCYRSDNSQSQCGANTGGCKIDRDCPKRGCVDSLQDCFENTYKCDATSRKCLLAQLHFPRSVCDQAQGRCIPRGVSCKVDCDCSQGQACLQGSCRTGVRPTFCCTKSGCPKGKVCSLPSGASGLCGGFSSCSQGGDCGKAYCTQAGQDCILKTPICTQGSCTETTTKHPQKVCDRATGRCIVGCSSDQDCKPFSCVQSGKFCKRSSERCLAGKCQAVTTSDVGTYNTSSGLCKPPVRCTSFCDCPQGQFCYQGKCVRNSYPVYCCKNPGCPS